MNCTKCNKIYKEHGIVENSIVYFCRNCYSTTWVNFPKYLPQEQYEQYANKIYQKDSIPNHLEILRWDSK